MADLRAGQRADLECGPLVLELAATDTAALARHAELVLVGVRADGGVCDSVGMISGGGREMRAAAGFLGAHQARLDLGAAPTALARIYAVLHVHGDPLALGGLRVSVGAWRFDLGSVEWRAVVLLEIYRRGDGWRLHANGQGFRGGLEAAGRALGVPLGSRPSQREPEPPPRGGGLASGSGFAVTPRHVLTNHHVIEGATRLEAVSEAGATGAQLVASDPRNDLALLRLEREGDGVACFRENFDLDLGEDVVVLGFPLQGLLASGPQVSGGNVAALSGPADDSLQFQFTAPIASGASGGPVLDAAGRVIGVVRATLNHEELRRGGNTAENVNFAVKSAAARAFLSGAGVTPSCLGAQAARSRTEVARDARRSLYRIRCEL